MNKEKPLSELTLEELNDKRKKVNKLNLSIQIGGFKLLMQRLSKNSKKNDYLIC